MSGGTSGLKLSLAVEISATKRRLSIEFQTLQEIYHLTTSAVAAMMKLKSSVTSFSNGSG